MGPMCQRLSLVEVSVGKGNCRGVVVSDVKIEGLCGLFSNVVQGGDLSSSRVQIAEGDKRRHPPTFSLCAKLCIGKVFGEGVRLVQHPQDLFRSNAGRCPVGADEHGGEPEAVATLAGRSHARNTRGCGTVVVALEVKGSSEAGQEAHSKVISRFVQRLGSLFKKFNSALIDDPRPPACFLIANRGHGEEIVSANVSGDLDGVAKRGQPGEDFTTAVTCVAELQK